MKIMNINSTVGKQPTKPTDPQTGFNRAQADSPGVQAASTGTQAEQSTAALAEAFVTSGSSDDPVSQFKEIDKDGDLKITDTEYYLHLVDKYITNNPGLQMPADYNNIGDFITAQFEEFKQFAGEDCSMNIDEFRDMLDAHLEQARKHKEQHKRDVEEITALKDASDKCGTDAADECGTNEDQSYI